MISNNLDIQGHFTFNSEKYSVNDLVNALLAQGIIIHKVGNNLKIGQKLINPIINNAYNFPSPKPDQINENVIQGLASQIQRIFSEINKLKDHLGVNNNGLQDLHINENLNLNFSSIEEKNTSPKTFESKTKWESFIPSKNFDFQTEKNTFYDGKKEFFDLKNESSGVSQTPIITLGKKKNSSLIEEYTDLVTNKGVADDEALDSLSTKLFNTANKSLYNENKQDLLSTLHSSANDSSSLALPSSEYSAYGSNKCDKCNSKIPTEAQFCSKCGTQKK